MEYGISLLAPQKIRFSAKKERFSAALNMDCPLFTMSRKSPPVCGAYANLPGLYCGS